MLGVKLQGAPPSAGRGAVAPAAGGHRDVALEEANRHSNVY